MRDVDRHSLGFRIHPERGCVDDDLGIRMKRDRGFVGHGVFARLARNRDKLFCAEVGKHGFCGLRGSARAEDESLFAAGFNARAEDHLAHTVKIRIVADQLAVDLLDRVDRADLFCGVADEIKMGNDFFLIRNRHVDALELACFKKGRNLVGGKLAYFVGIIREGFVYFF